MSQQLKAKYFYYLLFALVKNLCVLISVLCIIFIDINECDNPQICQYGTCINTPGSFVCECPPNYTLAPNGAGCVGKYLTVFFFLKKNLNHILFLKIFR